MVGPTGRANKSGIAVTFVKTSEENNINYIERHVKATIVKKELPTIDDIFANRMLMIQELINVLKENDYKDTKFNQLLDTLTEKELKNIVGQLLEDKVTSSLGSNFTIDTTVSSKKSKSKSRILETGDTVRVFMTIGKLDKIEKREFLSFIEKTAKVPEGTCSGVEIMTKFTFMNIKKDKYDLIVDKCDNIKYKGRTIRIEKAKK